MSPYSAPSVVYPLVRSRLQACSLLALWGAASLVLMAWQLIAAFSAIHAWLALFAILISAGWVYRELRRSVVGQVAWDGSQWEIEGGPGTPSATLRELSAVLDLQGLMLLRAVCMRRGRARPVWLWVHRRTMTERWTDLRRAVYFPGRSSVTVPGATQRATAGSADRGPA